LILSRSSAKFKHDTFYSSVKNKFLFVVVLKKLTVQKHLLHNKSAANI